jgi:hypothetical protein
MVMKVYGRERSPFRQLVPPGHQITAVKLSGEATAARRDGGSTRGRSATVFVLQQGIKE